MPELVVNATNIMSPLCYTVLKVEPYTVCPFRCVYCYSRWYMRYPTEYPYPRPKALGMLLDFVRKVYRRGLKPIPFRLSTLVDPFPPVEQLYRFTERVLRTFLEFGYPVVVNTKSVFYTHEPLKGVLEKLLDMGLAVLQISISSLDPAVAEKIEPRAPTPGERLRAVQQLGSTGIPLILRLSPYIPYVSPTDEVDAEDFAGLCKEMGVRHVIVEALRIESDGAEALFRAVGVGLASLESYSLREVEGLRPVLRLPLSLREKAYSILVESLSRCGIAFATCKEGLFRLHTAPDCCGVYMLKDCVARLTLYDVYRYSAEVGKRVPVPVSAEVIRAICRRYSRLCLEDLDPYPRAVSKALRYHEKKLLRVLENADLLNHVAPHMLDRLEGSREPADQRPVVGHGTPTQPSSP